MIRYKLWTPEIHIVPNAMVPDDDGEWVLWRDVAPILVKDQDRSDRGSQPLHPALEKP